MCADLWLWINMKKRSSQLLLIVFFAILFVPMILLSRELDFGIISMSIFGSLIGSLILYFVITLIINVYNRLHPFWFFLFMLQFKRDKSLSDAIKFVSSFWEILDVFISGNVQMSRQKYLPVATMNYKEGMNLRLKI